LRLGDSYNLLLGDSIPYWTAIELQREREEKRGTEAWDSQEAAPEEFLACGSYCLVCAAWQYCFGRDEEERERESIYLGSVWWMGGDLSRFGDANSKWL